MYFDIFLMKKKCKLKQFKKFINNLNLTEKFDKFLLKTKK